MCSTLTQSSAKASTPAERSAAQRRAEAETIRLWPGSWSPDEADPLLGFLVLEGLVTRRVTLGTRRSIELLGPGDLIRPLEADPEDSSVAAETNWTVVDPTHLAVLDGRFARGMADYPEVFAQLLGRGAWRSRTLALRLAIAQVPQLTARLHFLLWHLADRFGRVESEGVLLPLRLSHGILAELVCAQRPSVSVALKELERGGLVVRLPQREWRLRGDPPAVFEALCPSPVSAAAAA